MLYRSSYSNGWHLYIFFGEPVSSRDLFNQLRAFLKLHDFRVAKGTLEVFPHPGEGSNGQGLRLPLQPGFAWLDQNTLDVEHERSELSATKALEFFVDVVESWANTRHDFHQMKACVEHLAQSKQAVVATVRTTHPTNNVVPIRRVTVDQDDHGLAGNVRSVFQVLPPGIKSEIWLKGRDYYAAGLTGPSQRAEAIYCLSHYLFYGDPQLMLPALGYGYEQERKWAIEQILADKHHGHSEDINRSRPDAISQVFRAANWVPPHRRAQQSKPYSPQVPIAWVRHNANLKIDSRAKIKGAVDEFVASGKPFSVRDLRDAAGCCEKTLYKHQDLWRAAKEELSSGRFASVGHQYNAGVGGGSQENPLPAPALEKIMPPGRLAARRVVYELRMRDERAARQKSKEKKEFAASADEQWRNEIRRSMPDDISRSDTAKLKRLVVLYNWQLPRCPDEESQQWLLGVLGDIRSELTMRQAAIELRCLDQIVIDQTEPEADPCDSVLKGTS